MTIIRLRDVCVLLVVSATALTPAVIHAQDDLSYGQDASTADAHGPGVRAELSGFFNNLAVQGSYPFRLAWHEPGRAVLGAGVLAGLVMLDPVVHDATHTDASSGSWGETMAKIGGGKYTLPLIAAFGVAGMLGRPHESDTAILLAESAASTGLWTSALKEVSRRTRPRETAESDGDWTGPGAAFAEDAVGSHGLQSFPSGHSSGTWAVATVLAHQYPSHHVVPVLAYSGAAAMSYSRMVVDAHWFSDVVVGALIGYGCARQTIGAREARESASDGNSHPLRVYLDMGNGYRGVGLSYGL